LGQELTCPSSTLHIEEGEERSRSSWIGRLSSGSNNEEEEKASAGFSKVRAAELLDVRTREVYLGLVETSLVSNYISIWGRGGTLRIKARKLAVD
jgi:hypothetical protein